jgi:microcystin-dependent protein
MTEPYTGEIRYFGFNFAPANWSFANGSTVPIRQWTALYSLLGIQFGGNGTTTFQLPNLASRMIVGTGQGPGLTPRQNGDVFGTTNVTLQNSDLPPHQHTFQAFAGRAVSPQPMPANGSALTNAPSGTPFVAATPNTTMAPGAVTFAGGSQSHSNVQPMLGINACIAMVGLYPSFP